MDSTINHLKSHWICGCVEHFDPLAICTLPRVNALILRIQCGVMFCRFSINRRKKEIASVCVLFDCIHMIDKGPIG